MFPMKPLPSSERLSVCPKPKRSFDGSWVFLAKSTTGRLESLRLHDVLANEEDRDHRVARHAVVLAVELHGAVGEREHAAARGRDVARHLGHVLERRLVTHGAVDVHLGDVGGLPASIAATNFGSRSPKVAQSVSTVTLRSLAQFCTCFSRTSLPAVTKLLKSHTRSLVEPCAAAMLFSTVSPAAVPPVMIPALRRNSRRPTRPASNCAARSLSRRSIMSPFGCRWRRGQAGPVVCERSCRGCYPVTHAGTRAGASRGDGESSAAPDLVDFLHAGMRFLERGLGAEPAGHHAPRHVAEHVLRLDLDGGAAEGAGIARPHAP